MLDVLIKKRVSQQSQIFLTSPIPFVQLKELIFHHHVEFQEYPFFPTWPTAVSAACCTSTSCNFIPSYHYYHQRCWQSRLENFRVATLHTTCQFLFPSFLSPLFLPFSLLKLVEFYFFLKIISLPFSFPVSISLYSRKEKITGFIQAVK